MPVVCFTTLHASLSSERVFRPRKSILIKPVDSITWPSYWVTAHFKLGKSGSSAVETGTWSLIGLRLMIKPQACIPVPRMVPSSILAYLMVLRSRGSAEASASRSSGTHSRAFFKFSLRGLPSGASGRRSGIAFFSALARSSGNFSTRATSAIEFFIAILLYVMICAQFSAPYFSITHRSTLPRPSSSKSVSISGKFTRSGFRKRSKSKSYFSGSIFVIPRQ